MNSTKAHQAAMSPLQALINLVVFVETNGYECQFGDSTSDVDASVQQARSVIATSNPAPKVAVKAGTFMAIPTTLGCSGCAGDGLRELCESLPACESGKSPITIGCIYVQTAPAGAVAAQAKTDIVVRDGIGYQALPATSGCDGCLCKINPISQRMLCKSLPCTAIDSPLGITSIYVAAGKPPYPVQRPAETIAEESVAA